MTIVSPLPVVSQTESRPLLRALALTQGQTVEGRVIGPGPDGATLVQVGRQAMSLSLPGSTQIGTLLTLDVQQSEGHLRLALVSSQPPTAQQLPATSVEISQRPAPQAPLTYAPPTNIPAAATGAVVGAAPGVLGAAALAGPAMASATAATSSSNTGAPVIAPPAPTIAAAALTPQRPGASPYGLPGLGTSPSGSQQVAPQLAHGAVPTPQAAALSQMVQQALPAQVSLGAVSGLLAAVVGKVAMPEPVLKAARQLLANQLSATDGKVDATALKSALRSSGIFQETALSQGSTTGAATDTKSSLLAMRQGLAQWLGNQAPIAQMAQVPPPLRHVPPRARVPEVPLGDIPSDSEEIGRLLLDRTEGALSRVRLHQHASLPDPQRPGESFWSTDLPMAVGQYQTILHLQIHHDAGGEQARPEDRGWQVRFALNLPDLGEVGAQVSIRGQTTGIMLWADQDATATAFEAELNQLRASLEAVGLKPGALVVRHGAPSEAPPPAASGQFLDATR